jgi:MoaA/NifB/PqqE/SkfB family radical SAM enzyme
MGTNAREFSQFKILNHLDRIQEALAGDRPPPVTLEIDPTNDCNHKCIWCIDQNHRKNNPAMLERDAALRVIDEAKKLGVRSLVIKGGGEPLTYPHIEELLLHAKKTGFELGIITNGEKILDYQDVIKKTCSWMRISLDSGSSEIHQNVHRPGNPNAFEKIFKGISAIADTVFCGIIYIIHPKTFHEMSIAAKRVKANGCKYIGFKRVISKKDVFDAELLMSIEANYLFAKRQYECKDFSVMGFRIYNFKDGKNKKPYDLCLGHHLIGILCADGKVYACCSTRGNPDFAYGNIYDNSLEEIWHSEKRKQVLEKISAGDCRKICLGHTSYMRYDHYNDLFEYLHSQNNPHGNFL